MSYSGLLTRLMSRLKCYRMWENVQRPNNYSVASLGGGDGRTAHGWHPTKIIFVAKFSVFFSKFSHKKNNFSRVSPLEGVTRGGKETTAEKVITLQRRWLKSSSVFWKKNMVTPSVASPGDTNPSDATAIIHYSVLSRWIQVRFRG